ncbi:SUKH-4 family immunity protein [Streptomyces netropsis]|uniref:SUKH-4 family immunity protein n=1 Tax=Streptomyces netropsis TaxID=55404 RepID=UPI0037BCE0A6
MVTFAQAQERAERWVNGDVPAYLHREVRVREFDLGFVAWAEDRADRPTTDGGRARLVIARDSGETTLWPGLPVGEVIRRYEEEYGAVDESVPVADTPPKRLDLEATSFLLSPPQWLQDAADAIGIPDRRSGSSSAASSPDADAPAPSPAAPSVPAARADAGRLPAEAPAAAAPAPSAPAPSAPAPSAPAPEAAVPPGATPWAGADTNTGADDSDRSVGLPATVFAPALEDTGAPDAASPAVPADAKTALMATGSALPRTAIAPAIEDPAAPVPGAPAPVAAPEPPAAQPAAPPSVPPAAAPAAPPAAPPGGYARTQLVSQLDDSLAPGTPDVPGGAQVPGAAGAPGAPQVPSAPNPPQAPGVPGAPGGGAHAAATMLAGPGTPGQPGAPVPPGPPGAPGQPHAFPGAPGQPPAAAYPGQPGAQPPAAPAPGQPQGVHAAATMLAGPGTPGMPGAPGAAPVPPGPPGAPGQGHVPGRPQAPGAPGQPGAQPPAAPAPGQPQGVHAAATMLAGPGTPGMPGAPGQPPGAPMPPAAPMGAAAPAAPGGYGYPQAAPSGVPTVGPGYMAVLRYRAQDGSEQQIIRRSAPGTPHPEWQILHELRAMNVPPQQVLELHTELESCDLPGGYCARMVRETWPQVRISHTAAYGRDHLTRQQGVRHLVEHQGELHQVADGPARPAPNRVPLPHPGQVQQAPPVAPDGIARELVEAFGPQGIFRFDQRAVSRQGVPDIVAQTLVWAGLPMDFGPFFWGQAQPGRPVPTLAELAAERGVRPSPDAGSYLVMGSDFGRQLCVQYGTAHIVAVPVEAGPDGGSVAPQFVNTSLPQFVRCLALLGKMWRWRYGLTPEQAGRWTVDFQAQLMALDPAALSSPENWWAVLLEQMWDGLF